MVLRSAALACAAALIASLAMPAAAETAATQARCEEMSFRLYFDRGSAELSSYAMDTLATAARNVEGCSYAELHVAMDPANRLAAARGNAILAAASGRDWNVAQVEARSVTRIAAYNGPEYAEIIMTPNAITTGAPITSTDAGV